MTTISYFCPKVYLELIPKLAMNGNEFAPDDGGTSELNESEIIGSFLLKADK